MSSMVKLPRSGGAVLLHGSRQTDRLIQRLTVLMGLAVLVLGLLAAPAAAATPRVQFYEGYAFQSDKLDKDAPGQEPILDLLGRHCFFWECWDWWGGVISSIDTTGGGQPGAWLRIYDNTYYRGACVLLPPNVKLFDLRLFSVGLPAGQNWDNRIASFEVFVDRPSDRPECRAMDRLAPSVPSGYLSNPATSTVADVSGRSMNNHAQVQTWAFLGLRNQLWRFIEVDSSRKEYVIQAVHSIGCLAVRSSTDLIEQQIGCGFGLQPGQRWQFSLAYLDSFGVENYLVRSVGSVGQGRCLALTFGVDPVGAPLRVVPCAHSLNQLWRTESPVIHASTTKVLDVPGFSAADGTTVQLWNFIGERNQDWHLEPTNPNLPLTSDFRLRVQHDQKCLDVGSAGPFAGVPVVQNRCSDNRTQLWTRDRVGTNSDNRAVYQLRNLAGSNVCLDMPLNLNPVGAPLRLARCSGMWNQGWLLEIN